MPELNRWWRDAGLDQDQVADFEKNLPERIPQYLANIRASAHLCSMVEQSKCAWQKPLELKQLDDYEPVLEEQQFAEGCRLGEAAPDAGAPASN